MTTNLITNVQTLNLNYAPKEVCDTSKMSQDEWLEWRTTGIGGSDAATCLNVNPYKTKRELFYEKTGVNPIADNEPTNWIACAYGHALEGLVADVFSTKTGLEVFEVKKMYQHPLFPFMQANVDRFIKLPDGTVGILECKTCTYEAKDKWANHSIPENYEIQVRQYMAVMNISVAYIACLWDNNETGFAYTKITRDLDFEKNLINKEMKFWHCVEHNTPPELDENGDLCLATLQKYVIQKSNESQLSETYANVCEKWLTLSEEKSKKEKEVEEIRDAMSKLAVPVVQELNGNNRAFIETENNKYYVSYKGRNRTSVSKSALAIMKEHDPDVYNRYVTTTTSSPIFSLKKYEVKK